LGAPSLARSGSGHAGCETSNVLPITPGNAVPGLYSLSAIKTPFEYYVVKIAALTLRFAQQ
jgi:hypothetical protein